MEILLVEDDNKIGTVVKRGLDEEGFSVEVALDGDTGLWLATEGTFDLILLDIMLPGRNGFQICAELRARGIWTPIMMLTAKDGDLDEAEALDTGADDYLTKPFSFPVLVARVRSILRRVGGRVAPAPANAGDLRIDPTARRVWRGDRDVTVTARQFEVLESVIASTGLPQLSGDEDLLVQVVTNDGTVRLASANLAGMRPITSLVPGHRTVQTMPGRPEVFRVLVRRVVSDGRPALVIVGTNNDHITDPISILSRLLATAVPVVILALGALTWWLTGRTLRPVETMRVEMAGITGTNLGRRVAEPAAGDEIARLARTMNATLDRLEGAIRRQQRFVADASHELRSPLTRMRSELEVDIARAQPNETRTTQASVLEETITLQHLVDDLLHLARVDGAPALMRSQRVDLDDIVFREARRLQERSSGQHPRLGMRHLRRDG